MLSIILPVYNVEKELRRCLDSIVNQTMGKESMELIAVNDGSTDSSEEILKEYAAQYDWIRMICQENHGLGAARNRGLEAATGEWIVFIDSDDYLLPDYAQKLVSAMEQKDGDLGICDALVERDGTRHPYLDSYCWHRFKRRCNQALQYSAAPDLLLFQPSVWRRIYRRAFLVENKLLFPESLLFEDIPFHYRTLELAKAVVLVPEALYIYNDDRGSSITKRKDRKLFDFLEIFFLVHRFDVRKNGYSYVLEKRHLKWASQQLEPSLQREFKKEMKESLRYYTLFARIKGFFLRLRIKLHKGPDDD